MQVDGVQGYDKDQIALVVPDPSNFTTRIPIILVTPRISCIVNVMKEREIDALAMPWANVRVAHVLSVCRAMATEADNETTNDSALEGYNELVYTKDTKIIDVFSSCVIPVRLEKAYIADCINIMMQVLQTEDGSLPQYLTVQNAYTELRWGSKNALVEIRNNTAYLQILQKKTLVVREVAAAAIPKPLVELEPQKEEGDLQDSHMPKLTVRQRQGKLFDELDLSRLKSWSPELADAAHWLLVEYHNVFSLEPMELGCTHSTEQTIMVTDDAPFKEQFRQILPPLVIEV